MDHRNPAVPLPGAVSRHFLFGWKEAVLDYTPAPRDTSQVVLPAGIGELTELLARNAHENWAALRIAEGWRYGPRRDDVRREHPSLVPYDRLPESEREYDRRTAIETIKTILSLGYSVAKG